MNMQQIHTSSLAMTFHRLVGDRDALLVSRPTEGHPLQPAIGTGTGSSGQTSRLASGRECQARIARNAFSTNGNPHKCRGSTRSPGWPRARLSVTAGSARPMRRLGDDQ